MRIAFVYDSRLPNSDYRARLPGRALAERGHEVLWPDDTIGVDRVDRLLGCDVVHLHRQYGPVTPAVVPLLARSGVAVVYDNDDDLSAVPIESPAHEAFSGERGARVEHAWRRRDAALVTTTSPTLARVFAAGGAADVEVIENPIPEAFLRQPRRPHDGVVVGWIAGRAHAADPRRLGMPLLLRRLPDAHVATVGLDVELGHQRYHHLPLGRRGRARAREDPGAAGRCPPGPARRPRADHPPRVGQGGRRLRPGGRTTRLEAAVRDGRIRFTKRLTGAQRRKTTGILSLRFPGDDGVRPDEVRLRAANGKAKLRRTTARIAGGRLQVAGTIDRRARGVVRVRLGYTGPDGVAFHTVNAPIRKGGRWSVDDALPAAAAAAGGQLSIQFTGDERARLRGEQDAKAVTP